MQCHLQGQKPTHTVARELKAPAGAGGAQPGQCATQMAGDLRRGRLGRFGVIGGDDHPAQPRGKPGQVGREHCAVIVNQPAAMEIDQRRARLGPGEAVNTRPGPSARGVILT